MTKKHIIKDGKCINLNKRICDLKSSQRELLDSQLKSLYFNKRKESGKLLNVSDKVAIIEETYNTLEDKAIWIPFDAVKTYFSGKIAHYENCYNKKVVD